MIERNTAVVDGFLESRNPAFHHLVAGWFMVPGETECSIISEVFSGYGNVFCNWIAYGSDAAKKPGKCPWMGFWKRPASTDKPKSWKPLNECIDAVRHVDSTKVNGIGIFLNGCDLTVLDIDHIKRDGEKEDIEDIRDLEITRFILDKFSSYTEVSPGGKGLHIFLKGKVEIPEGFASRKNGEFHYNGYTAQFEVFDGEKFHASATKSSPRFMTISGVVIDEEHAQISPVNEDTFIEFAKECGNIYVEKAKPVSPECHTSLCAEKDDGEISITVNKVPNVAKLFDPRYIHFTCCAESELYVELTDTGYRVVECADAGHAPDDYYVADLADKVDAEFNSPSEYDAALMGRIAFLTDNPEQMKRIFQGTSYYRNFRSIRDKYKVRREDYWNRTIEGALKWSSSHPDANPFRFMDLDYLYGHLHNGQLTDRGFIEYLNEHGVLDLVRVLLAGKKDSDSGFIRFDENIGCWDIANRTDAYFTDVLYKEVDRLIGLIELKREIAKKIEEEQPEDQQGEEGDGEKEDGKKKTQKESDPVYAYLVGLQNYKGISSLANMARKLSTIQSRLTDFDTVKKCSDYLNFEDCRLNLNTGEFEETNIDDMSSKSCALKARPYWNKDGVIRSDGAVKTFIHDFFTPTTRRDKGVFQEGFYTMFMSALGASLYGVRREKKVFFLWGPGNTGKSLLMDTIGEALGGDSDRGYFMTLDRSFFTVNRTGNNDSLVNLKGRRLGRTSEMSADDIMQNEFIKTVSGIDTLRGSKKFEKQVQFDNTATLWIETNEMPRSRNGYDMAFFDRIAIINCEHVVEPKDQDKTLKQKLLKDTEGLVWLLRTAAEIYRKKGLYIPREAEKLKNDYVKEASSIIGFLENYTVETYNPEDWISSEELYQRYKDYYTSSNNVDGLTKRENYIESKDTFVKVVTSRYKTVQSGVGKKVSGQYRRGFSGLKYEERVEKVNEDENDFGWYDESEIHDLLRYESDQAEPEIEEHELIDEFPF